MIKTPLFKYSFNESDLLDKGKQRQSNQDEIVSYPEQGFFAICDGMGGLLNGAETSRMIAEILPKLVEQAVAEFVRFPDPDTAGRFIKEYIQMVSNNIYNTTYKGRINFGSTLCCVWLVDEYAVFLSIGDSRGYILPRYKMDIRRVTKDHNIASVLVERGEMTEEEAYHHPGSTRLTRFMGMPPPAEPDVYIKKLQPGDRILLCSDGLYGMVDKVLLRKIMRSSKSSPVVCRRLIDAANESGGKDNISAVFIRIGK